MNKVLIIVKSSVNADSKEVELLQHALSLGLEPATVMLEQSENHQKLSDLGSATQYHSSNHRHKYDPEFYAQLILKAAEDYQANMVWYVSDEDTTVYATQAATHLKTLNIIDAFNITKSEENFVVERMAYAGNVIEKNTFQDKQIVIGFKTKSFSVENTPVKGTLNPIALEVVETSTQIQVKEIVESFSEEFDLASSEIVVGVGRGAKNEEGVAFVKKFAGSLKAAFGGSRAIIDAGLLPSHLQIGQTGKTISPKFYICVGISGAVQHVAGINHSKTILAINSDPEAPIFKVANYGIVGDLFEVLPVLETKIKEITAT